MEFSIIVAIDEKFGIGKNGTIPWKLQKDMKYFKEVTSLVKDETKRNIVIMGRLTYESIPKKFRPLANRINIVISHDFQEENVIVASNFEDSIKKAQKQKEDGLVENIFVIGGGSIYKEAILHNQCKKLYVTIIKKDFQCDTHFYKSFEKEWTLQNWEDQEENGTKFSFTVYTR